MTTTITAKANVGAGTETLAVEQIGGVLFPVTKLYTGADGVDGGPVTVANPLPVAGLVEIANDVGNPIPISGALTNTELRASPLAMVASEDPATAGTIVAVNGEVVYTNTSGKDVLLIAVDGTYSATMIIEAQYRTGAPFVSVAVNPQDVLTTTIGSLGAYVNQTRAWLTSLIGVVAVRIRATAFTSGTVNVRMQPSSRPVSNTSGVVAAQIGTWTVGLSANTPTLAAGTNLAGDVGTQYRANATGAATPVKVISAATANPNLVKATAGRVIGYDLINNATAVRYLKLFNKATAPVPGTDVPTVIIPIPANGGKAQISHPGGIGFATGIGYSIVAGSADLDNTAIGSGEVVGTILFA